MSSHFFYPTATGSLGEARRLGCEETLVMRESESPASHSNDQPLDCDLRSELKLLIAERNDDGPHSDFRDVPAPKQ